MKKVIILILITTGLVGAFIFFRKDDSHDTANTSNAPAQVKENSEEAPKATATQTDPNVKYITMEEVAIHGSDFDNYKGCWTVIHDKVYDITEYADSFKHPGGEMIYQACGKDGTSLFETRPEVSSTPHSADARKTLEKHYIGDLKK